MIVEILGLPGAGKTTTLTWICLRALAGKPLKVGHFSYTRYIGEVAKYDRVFSNVPIDGKSSETDPCKRGSFSRTRKAKNFNYQESSPP